MNRGRRLTVTMTVVGLVVGCTWPAGTVGPELAGRGAQNDVRTYTKLDPQFGFQLEYPSTWSVEETTNTSKFVPKDPPPGDGSVLLVWLNYRTTPPPPISYTYTTLRTVRVNGEDILVRKREPGPASESYIAELKRGDYVFEFRFSAARKYDDVFDRMLSTFKITLR